MPSKIALLTAALLVSSCTVPPPAPLPPGAVPVRSPKSAPAPAYSVVDVDSTNLLYLEAVASNVFKLSWVTNHLRAFYLTSTRLDTPPELWTTSANLTEQYHFWGNRRGVYLTNQLPQQYFRLVRLPSNHLGLGWCYDFSPDTNNVPNTVDGFRLYYGNVSRRYTTNVFIPGHRLWTTLALPTLATNWFFMLRAECSTNGLQSEDSNEVQWPVP